jgi:hypothetical protein
MSGLTALSWFASAALASDPAASVVPPAAPGARPPVAHVTTDPLLPQAYRVVPPGVYPCEVDIVVRANGTVADMLPIRCDTDALYALATAVVQWTFEPATRDGVPVDGVLRYRTEFEVRSALPRKHVVGFAGVGASVGGAGLAGVEARVHMGETLSATLGYERDLDTLEGRGTKLGTNAVRADLAFSSRRRHFEKRGIYGLALGGWLDDQGANGAYAAMRLERMAGPPGLAVGADAGLSLLFTDPPTVDDVGPFTLGATPFAPWVRASLVWYAPIPRDRFVVVPREQDPTVYEPPPPPPEEVPDLDGVAFPGIKAIHWAEIDPDYGDPPDSDALFANWPPGTYACNVRVAVGIDGKAERVRAEQCPSVGRALAEQVARSWVWLPRPGGEVVQAVFPAPFFVEHEDARRVRAQVTNVLDGDKAAPLPRFPGRPEVWARTVVAPEWGSTLPTRSCSVDVDLDATGAVLRTRWISGDVEVRPRVEEALAGWRFFPVIVAGEPTPVRARLVLCER